MISNRTRRVFLSINLLIVFLVMATLHGPAPAAHAQGSLEIWQIQGADVSSPYEGQTVTTEDNIVTAVGTQMFFIQTPTDRTDGDPATSDGILVYTNRRPEVQQGDRVTVTGSIEEYYGMTEFGSSDLEVTVLSSGASLPAPVVLTAPFPPTENQVPDAFERYEGMLVQVSGAVASSPAIRYYKGQYREEYEVAVTLGNPRPFREPGIDYPATGEPSNVQVFDGNPEGFEFGFGGGADTDNFAPLSEPVNTGATLSGTGVINYRFDRYQLWPLAGTFTLDLSTEMSLPQPVPAPEPGELTVASQNAHNLFDTMRDPGKDDASSTPFTEQQFVDQLDKLAAQICDVLQAPDIVAMQEVEKIEVLDNPDPDKPDLVGEIESRCGVQYSAYLLEGLDGRGIDNAYLTRDTIQVNDVFQIGYDAMYEPTVASGREHLFDRPPLVLEATYDPNGVAFPITVINVHNKSYLDSERADVRERRYQEAVFIAQYVQDRQTADPNINLMVTGDFNDYQFNDGLAPEVQIIAGTITALGPDNAKAVFWPDTDYVQPDLVIEEVARLDPSQQYSYVYDGSAQSLDHMLVSQALDAYVSRMSYSRGNADASYQYEDDPTVPMRSSDHDAPVIAFQTTGYVAPPTPTPSPTPLPTATPTTTPTPAPTATAQPTATLRPAATATSAPTATEVPAPAGGGQPPSVGILIVIVVLLIGTAWFAMRGKQQAS